MIRSSTRSTDIDLLVRSIRSQRGLTRIAEIEQEIINVCKAHGTPIIRGCHAHFFSQFAGPPSISVTGDWNGWDPKADAMERLHPKSSLYYLKKNFPIDARFAYRLVLGGKESINDPLNPHLETEVFGTNTVLRMPAYQSSNYFREPAANVTRGSLSELTVAGKKTGRRDYTRSVQIYLPAHSKRSNLPVLYVHDGAEAIVVGKFINVLDNLFHHEPNLPKCAVVFVPPVQRDREYMLHGGFAEWISHILVPTVESKLKLRIRATQRGTLGASLGGLLSAQLGFLYPKVFGCIAAQSPAFWVQDKKILTLFENMRHLPLRWFLHTGTVNDALTESRSMLEVLEAKNYDVTYRETNESHNWGNWRGQYEHIVRWFVSSV